MPCNGRGPYQAAEVAALACPTVYCAAIAGVARVTNQAQIARPAPQRAAPAGTCHAPGAS